MLVDRGRQCNAITEHAVLKQATIKGLKHIAHLEGTFIGVTHNAFSLKEYEMDFRSYLSEHRDPKYLPKLLE